MIYNVKNIKRILSVLAATATAATIARAEVSFSETPSPSQSGKFILRWNAPGCSDLYISNVGAVDPPAGEFVVAPAKTTTYTLFVRCDTSVDQKSVTVIIEGQKGMNVPANLDLSAYRKVVSFDCDALDYVGLLKRVHTTLQDDFKYSVDEIEKDAEHIFVTSPTDLSVPRTESAIARRNLSVIVGVPVPQNGAKTVKAEIRALVKYRRRVEATWRTETDLQPYRSDIEAIRTKITAK